MTSTNLIVETHQAVGLIRLNRPDDLNALSVSLMADLAAALKSFDADPAIGAIVVTGNDRVFAAGADIKDFMQASAAEMLAADVIGAWDSLRQVRIPIIAAVSGWCLGGGMELAMACDMIVASEKARFGQPEIKLGVIPGAGGTQRLTRAVGKALAMEIILNDRMLSAEEACQFGLVNAVYPVESYLQRAIDLANQIAERAPIAVRLGKEMINLAFETALQEGVAAERRAFYFLFSTADQKEGMQAFTEKRPPTWKGS